MFPPHCFCLSSKSFGCSSVWNIEARDIKKGDKLKISYVGDVTGQEGHDRQVNRYMKKWFERDFGCNIYIWENEEEITVKKKVGRPVLG